MHAAEPSAGARVLALPMSEATSLEYPNERAPIKEILLYTFRECASDQDQDNHRTNRKTLPHTATNSGIYPALPCPMLLNRASSTGRLRQIKQAYTVQHLHASLSD